MIFVEPKADLQRPTQFGAIDIRIRLLLLPLLVAYGFASRTLLDLLPVLLLLGLLGFFAEVTLRELYRLVWRLRWLLVTTLVLYLLFSPGRTLFGMAWLSRDGLSQGALVALQIAVAAFAASLLSRGGAENLAAGLVALLRPGRWIGLPVERWGVLLALVFRFFPVLRQSGHELMQQSPKRPAETLDGRIRAWAHLLEVGLLDLLDQADREAHNLAAGKFYDALPEVRHWQTSETLFALPLLGCWGSLFWSAL